MLFLGSKAGKDIKSSELVAGLVFVGVRLIGKTCSLSFRDFHEYDCKALPKRNQRPSKPPDRYFCVLFQAHKHHSQPIDPPVYEAASMVTGTAMTCKELTTPRPKAS